MTNYYNIERDRVNEAETQHIVQQLACHTQRKTPGYRIWEVSFIHVCGTYVKVLVKIALNDNYIIVYRLDEG